MIVCLPFTTQGIFMINPIGVIRAHIAPHTYVENRIVRIALSVFLSLAALYAQSWASALCLTSAAILWIRPVSEDPAPSRRSVMSNETDTMRSLPALVMLAARPVAAATEGDAFGPFPQRAAAESPSERAPRRPNKTFAAVARGDFQGGRGASQARKGRRKGRGQ